MNCKYSFRYDILWVASSVSSLGCRLSDRGIVALFPTRARDLLLLRSVHADCEAIHVCQSVDAGGTFPGINSPEREGSQSPHSNVEVENNCRSTFTFLYALTVCTGATLASIYKITYASILRFWNLTVGRPGRHGEALYVQRCKRSLRLPSRKYLIFPRRGVFPSDADVEFIVWDVTPCRPIGIKPSSGETPDLFYIPNATEKRCIYSHCSCMRTFYLK